jgi:hypothetical protein
MFNNITSPDPNKVMFTDSSGHMWGAYDKTVIGEQAEEQKQHIKVLELCVSNTAIVALEKTPNLHFKIYMDKTTRNMKNIFIE